ncbi:MAG: WYL domain-containing protein [Bacteroidales bacterium]|nr:WYL domain-containing protein [Bacteroidales bacterium]
MFSSIQKRHKDMYDHFQEMISSKNGITSYEFASWCKVQVWTDDLENKLPPINWNDTFRKMIVEFRNYIYSEKEGKNERYFLQKGIEITSSFYVMHVGFENIVSRSLNKNVLKLTYHHVNKPKELIEILVQPEYLRKYRGKTYIFGRYADLNGKLIDDKYYHIEMSMIDKLTISRRKKFTKSKIDWTNHFSSIIGIDSFENRNIEDVILKVKSNMLNRFLDSDIKDFVKFVDKTCSDKGFYKVILSIKRNKELERLILSYGCDVVVESPNKLKSEIIKHVKKMSDIYISN